MLHLWTKWSLSEVMSFFKHVTACVEGQYIGKNTGKDPHLVGEPSEVTIFCNGKETISLCDTGSCVSTCSERYYNDNLSDATLHPITELLHIECADGNTLPYKGFIEASIRVPELPDSEELICPMLVVSDTNYNQKTPILLGTNVLTCLMHHCKKHYGDNFLQKSQLKGHLYTALQCLILREKALKRNGYCLATVKSNEPYTISIGPNQSVTLECVTSHELNYTPTTVMLHGHERSPLPKHVSVTPTIYHYNGKKQYISVNLSNLSTDTVNIAPKSTIAELQPVVVENSPFLSTSDQILESPLDKVDINKNLSRNQFSSLTDVLNRHKHVFSANDFDIGNCSEFKHRIDLIDERPFKQRHRRIPPPMIEEVRQHIEELLANNIIRRSMSPWASAVVLVRKKNGKLRMCIDYRALNSRTIKDAYALPRPEDIFDSLHGSKWFSTIDMKSGYHQVDVLEEHKERTAFTLGPLGFYEFNKLPFGLSNSPSCYQRIMEHYIGDYNMKICFIYLDDLVIFSSTFDQHIERLQLVLTRLGECGMKLAPEKCHFAQKQVKFLGHVVSENGLETDPDKTERIRNYPRPKDADELRSFLALCGYYRRFVHNFSKVSKPLTDLLPPTSPKKLKPKKQVQWQWSDKHEQCFNNLKGLLTTPPVLAYPDFSKPFELHTDASGNGIGAVLYQKQNERNHVIAYASRSLTQSERNYSAFKREFLALKWAICDKFSDYLVANKFTVYTDNNPLTHVLTSSKLEAVCQRWISALSDYDFDIVYRPGSKNVDADCMSRYPHEQVSIDSKGHVALGSDVVKAICNVSYTAYVDILQSCSINVADITGSDTSSMSQLEIRELRKAQREDKIIGLWLRAVIDKRFPANKLWKGDKNHQTMSRHFEKFKVVRGLLYREMSDNEEVVRQLVLPEIYREQVLTSLHNELGHPGKDRTTSLVRDRFYWPAYTADVASHVAKCERCLRNKSSTNIRSPLVNITSRYPLELVCTDFLKVDACKGGIQNILVITDHFTKFSVAVPTKNQTAKTTADVLLNNFIYPYGIPTKLLSDQGANFESAVIKELCQMLNIDKLKTSIYHPQCNGISERYNRTLLSMLSTLEDSKKANWKDHISALCFAYNATKHESTKFSPFELMFNRKAVLPIDMKFQLVDDKITNDYVTELKHRIQTVQDIANKHLQRARDIQKHNYDKKAKAAEIAVGQKVLVRILAHKGPHKISDKFEQDVYEVVRQPREEIPVYVVKTPSGQEKTLHRNHLLLLNDVGCKDKPTPKPRCKRDNKVERDVNNQESVDSIFVSNFRDDDNGPAGNKSKEGGELCVEKSTNYSDISIPEQSRAEEEEEECASDEEYFLEGSEEEKETDRVTKTVTAEEGEKNAATSNNNKGNTGSMPIAPRRSARVRKPPDRLNLLQQPEFNTYKTLLDLHTESARLTTKLLSRYLDN